MKKSRKSYPKSSKIMRIRSKITKIRFAIQPKSQKSYSTNPTRILKIILKSQKSQKPYSKSNQNQKNPNGNHQNHKNPIRNPTRITKILFKISKITNILFEIQPKSPKSYWKLLKSQKSCPKSNQDRILVIWDFADFA